MQMCITCISWLSSTMPGHSLCQIYLLDAYPTNSIGFLRILYKGHSLRHIYFKYFFSLFAVNFNYPFLIQVTLIQVTTVCVVSVFLMALVLGLEKHCP